MRKGFETTLAIRKSNTLKFHALFFLAKLSRKVLLPFSLVNGTKNKIA